MRTVDHFWFVSKAVACFYLIVGFSMSLPLVRESHWGSALVIAVAAIFMASGHWLRFYWAFLTTASIGLIVNFASVFHYFPVPSGSGERGLKFFCLTFFVFAFILYIYFNQHKMVGKKY
ncbi:hypothetical protein [Lysobacter sp. Root690]|uniref:hypothetical protein n=1 Tax=Lysobacter sp. Root690 TaxID=1736588 RepID=UPI0012F83C45|nr:hypothetical protein [Lysobacter sp. Root690]